jgi:glycerophosphoryl diester phosphodiesterase
MVNRKLGQGSVVDKGYGAHVTDVIAHRGVHGQGADGPRENTVEAFVAAGPAGADGVELDARRTADGAIVVHHDAVLADGREVVACLRSDLPPWVPDLGAALDACAGLWVNVEIKNDPSEPDFDADDGVAEQVVAVLAARPEPAGTWLISSFNRSTIDRCRRLDPSLATAWLTAAPLDTATIDDVVAGGHVAVHPWDSTLDAEVVARCHAAGLRVNTWTCNDPVRAAELAAWGVDGICTDTVAEVRAALSR